MQDDNNTDSTNQVHQDQVAKSTRIFEEITRPKVEPRKASTEIRAAALNLTAMIQKEAEANLQGVRARNQYLAQNLVDPENNREYLVGVYAASRNIAEAMEEIQNSMMEPINQIKMEVEGILAGSKIGVEKNIQDIKNRIIKHDEPNLRKLQESGHPANITQSASAPQFPGTRNFIGVTTFLVESLRIADPCQDTRDLQSPPACHLLKNQKNQNLSQG